MLALSSAVCSFAGPAMPSTGLASVSRSIVMQVRARHQRWSRVLTQPCLASAKGVAVTPARLL